MSRAPMRLLSDGEGVADQVINYPTLPTPNFAAKTQAEKLNRRRAAKNLRRKIVARYKRGVGKSPKDLFGLRSEVEPVGRSAPQKHLRSKTITPDNGRREGEKSLLGKLGFAKKKEPKVEKATGVTDSASAPMRVKIRFGDKKAIRALRAAESPLFPFSLSSEERMFVAAQQPAGRSPDQFQEWLETLAKNYYGEIVPDRQYQMEDDSFVSEGDLLPAEEAKATFDDVRKRIGLDSSGDKAGNGVNLAIVDTGIANLPEFPVFRRSDGWAYDEAPWSDWNGHGTMCGAIAGATRTEVRQIEGVAPGAGLISCKTRLFDSELAIIYDYLRGLLASDRLPIVVSNSWGYGTGHPPQVSPEDDFPNALNDGIEAGLIAVFSAGNNHRWVLGPTDDSPNSIWLHKGRSDVVSVATCDLDDKVWSYSSRGPGQFFGDAGQNRKPDVTAPTPAYRAMFFGGEVKTYKSGWGTSGACPQVAGLAALLLSARPGIPRDELFDAIRETAGRLATHHEHAQGVGLIACGAAMARVLRKR